MKTPLPTPMKRINLRKLYRDLAAIDDSGKRDLSVVQIAECIAALGQYFRHVGVWWMMVTAWNIYTRAGVKSENPRIDDQEK